MEIDYSVLTLFFSFQIVVLVIELPLAHLCCYCLQHQVQLDLLTVLDLIFKLLLVNPFIKFWIVVGSVIKDKYLYVVML